ncbi:MAG: hypothetical protein LBP68_02040 [Acidobacteriota bacterium]|jgi:hypothetical protein|nr:hypothetical protein [Acidobacteriota bacterium]
MARLAALARNAPGDHRAVNIALVKPNEAAEAIKHAGIDIRGYRHVADTSGVKHAIKKHGNAAVEESRGQIAIGDKDISEIPAIVAEPDYRAYGTKTDLGLKAVLSFKKMPDGTVSVIEEVRTGKGTLAFKDMWKVPGARVDVSFFRAAASNAKSDTGVVTIINQKTGEAKEISLLYTYERILTEMVRFFPLRRTCRTRRELMPCDCQ